MALRIATGNVLMALGKPWMRAGFEISGLIVLLFAAITLTARLGTIGMPLALACSEWGMAVTGMVFIMRSNTWQLTLPNK
jgi:O-antigen/teichoic acid export membrane protein